MTGNTETSFVRLYTCCFVRNKCLLYACTYLLRLLTQLWILSAFNDTFYYVDTFHLAFLIVLRTFYDAGMRRKREDVGEIKTCAHFKIRGARRKNEFCAWNSLNCVPSWNVSVVFSMVTWLFCRRTHRAILMAYWLVNGLATEYFLEIKDLRSLECSMTSTSEVGSSTWKTQSIPSNSYGREFERCFELKLKYSGFRIRQYRTYHCCGVIQAFLTASPTPSLMRRPFVWNDSENRLKASMFILQRASD